MSRLRLAVIGGGENGEHEVSLASAASILHALDGSRYDAVPLTIRADGIWMDGFGVELSAPQVVVLLRSCDAVFPAVHGAIGEDGTLAAALRLLHVPYVGSDLSAGAVAMDKELTKLVAESVGILTAAGFAVASSTDPRLANVSQFPVVVKPSAAGSSLGLSIASTVDELRYAVNFALRFSDRVLVETFVHGREIDIAVLEKSDGRLLASPALEIGIRPGQVFDGDGKYGSEPPFTVPAVLEEGQQLQIEESALTMFRRLRCHGVARFDFFVTEQGLVLNEVNTMPGFTERSQVPRMFGAAGLDYASLVDVLVDAAVHRP